MNEEIIYCEEEWMFNDDPLPCDNAWVNRDGEWVKLPLKESGIECERCKREQRDDGLSG